MTTQEDRWQWFVGLTAEYQSKAVLDTMAEVVDEDGCGPDFLYQGRCKYVEFDDYGRAIKPDCIVGQVLYRLGASLDMLGQNNSSAIELTSCRFAASLHRSTVKVLAAAQTVQDHRLKYRGDDVPKTWGNALVAAVATHHVLFDYDLRHVA